MSSEGLVTSVFLAFMAFKLVDSGQESGILRTSPGGRKVNSLWIKLGWLHCVALLCNHFAVFRQKVIFAFIMKAGRENVVAFETFPVEIRSKAFATVARFPSDSSGRYEVRNYNVAELERWRMSDAIYRAIINYFDP